MKTIVIKNEWRTMLLAFAIGIMLNMLGIIVLALFGVLGYMMYLGCVVAIITALI